MKAPRRLFLDPQTQPGQAIVLVALMIVVLIGAIGLAIDGGLGYYYNNQAERAAGAAALSGVIFMPGQFTPAQAIPAATGNDATDRAIAEAGKNGFTAYSAIACGGGSCTATGSNGLTVTVAVVPGFDNKLSVTVTRSVPTFFMSFFGISAFTVSRTAIATYLPPLSLGQPGTQVGSVTSTLGTGGNNYYFMREEGYSTPRSQGDAFTPNPAGSGDVHAISRTEGSDPVGATLPDRGGYNYLVNLPNGGYIQVYNAIFAPDNCTSTSTYGSSNTQSCPGGGGALPASESWAGAGPVYHNGCDNHISPVTHVFDQCSTAVGTNPQSYYLHEEDSQNLSSYGAAQTDLYSTMEYTVEAVPTPFIRASDTIVSQVKVYPIDATGYYKTPANCVGACQPSKNYNPINSLGSYIHQTWDAFGNPVNMQTYHSWVDITNYTGGGDGGTFQRLVTPAPGPLPAGTYRLRVDTLGSDGSNPPTNGASSGGQAHKAYAVRVVDAAGLAGGTFTCTGCSVGAWDDMALYTPIAVPAGGHFDIPIFKVPPDYAGQTITLDVFDPGDISGGGNVDLYVLDNTGAIVSVANPASINVWDLGVSRTSVGPPVACTGAGGLTNPPTPCLAQTGQPQTATVRATTAGATNYNGHWIRFEVPIPSGYNPGLNPNNWWWSLRYQISTNVTATDTVTFAVGLKGNPAHLLSS
ncbi:MAG TPA: TadG family pilus assembly protein [Candidatus Dormibacteraeota bacterium]|nr:TadG family pilus assembly protein [Candidatus Dormibacteraeota bacterium]